MIADLSKRGGRQMGLCERWYFKVMEQISDSLQGRLLVVIAALTATAITVPATKPRTFVRQRAEL
jgi:hypothetical protein